MKLPRTIYAIQHNKTKRIYIGSSANVQNRYWNHIYRLRSGKHSIKDMQKDFDDFGEDFSLFILDEINSYTDRIKEYEWMKKYQSYIRGKGYNYNDKAVNIINAGSNLPLKKGIPEWKGDDKLLYEKLEHLCKEKGISIAKLEKDCDIGNATIRRWNKSIPRLDTLKKVADYFNKPIEYFLEQED